jgi:hypothetical protein|tara:strand:+ start:56 stop:424 length:369 start_codon:yes stop_codon:yes gene_type:complete
MADFPALTPQARTYTPGAFAARSVDTVSGKHITVRRNNASVNQRLTLTFVSDAVDDHNSIYLHYVTQNRFEPFDLPTSVLSGSDLAFATNYQFIYAGPPEVTYDPGVVTVSVELQLIPPYTL